MLAEIVLSGLDATTANQSLLRPRKKDNIVCVSSYGPTGLQPVLGFNSSILAKVFIVNDAIDMEAIANKAVHKGFEPMNHDAKKFVLTLNEFFNSKNIVPSNTFPISEGGVCIEIIVADKYYNFEIANSGEASFYKEEGNKIPEGWDYSYAGLINRLKTEFNG